MKMRKLMSLALAGVMVLSLAACGGGGSSAPASSDSGDAAASTEASAGGSLQVNIWDNNQLAGLQEIADEWSATSGVTAKINVVDWDNYWTLLEAGASGGQMPDVFWMHSNTAQMYPFIIPMVISMRFPRITTPSLFFTTRLSLISTV